MSVPSSSKGRGSSARVGEGELSWVVAGQVDGVRNAPFNSSIYVIEEESMQQHGFVYSLDSVVRVRGPSIEPLIW